MIAFFMSLTAVTEWSLVAAADRWPLMALKFGCVLALLAVTWWIYRGRDAFTAICVCALIFYVYSFGSGFYRPFYLLSVFQLSFLLTFFFPQSPRFFWTYFAICYVTYFVQMYLRWPDVPEFSMKLELADYLNICAQLGAMLAMCWIFVIRARKYREATEARFSLIGKHAARVTHDVKGMLTAPQIYLQQIEKSLPQELTGEVRTLVDLTHDHLEEIQMAIAELSRLAAPGQLPESHFGIAECLKATENMLKNKMGGVRLHIDGDIRVFADRSLISSIIFNLSTNSLAAIRECGEGEHWIRWSMDRQLRTIRCEDSGGGFSEQALRALRLGQPYSEFTDGSGLGLQIVRDSVARLNGTVIFENAGQGARVTLCLPEAIFA